MWTKPKTSSVPLFEMIASYTWVRSLVYRWTTVKCNLLNDLFVMNNYIQSLCVRNKVNSKYCISIRADKALCNIYFAGVTLEISDMHKTDFIFASVFALKPEANRSCEKKANYPSRKRLEAVLSHFLSQSRYRNKFKCHQHFNAFLQGFGIKRTKIQSFDTFQTRKIHAKEVSNCDIISTPFFFFFF